jgi:hypothetical protein
MTHYFNRVCKVVIENESKLEIEDCKIRFEIIKSCNPQENNGRIEIYNLSLATRKQIAASNSLVKLFAGYADNKGLIEVGQGDISSVRNNRSKTEIVTQIYIHEGQEKIKTNSVSLGFKGNVHLAEILNDFSSKTGLIFKSIAIDQSASVQNGYSAIGSPDTVLDELALIFKFTWSVQNGIILIRGNEKLNASEILLLSPSTGLILNPETVNKISRKLAKSPAPLPRNIYNVQAFLQPQLQVHDVIALESSELQGRYQILKISHTGDTRGNDWYSDMEVVAI